MTTIDMARIRAALPDRAKVKLLKKMIDGKSIVFLKCTVIPSLSDEEFEQCKQWQREIIGAKNISEFYTHTTGTSWLVYLKRILMEFENTTDEDIKGVTGVDVAAIKGHKQGRGLSLAERDAFQWVRGERRKTQEDVLSYLAHSRYPGKFQAARATADNADGRYWNNVVRIYLELGGLLEAQIYNHGINSI